ncbi:MAG: hypothetical protein OEM84_05945, partial [Acidimicrobiia bacterium]|nr:hypothetical protein [Acidimicrobiia bacterium]
QPISPQILKDDMAAGWRRADPNHRIITLHTPGAEARNHPGTGTERHSPVGRCDVGRAAGTASTVSTTAVPVVRATPLHI